MAEDTPIKKRPERIEGQDPKRSSSRRRRRRPRPQQSKSEGGQLQQPENSGVKKPTPRTKPASVKERQQSVKPEVAATASEHQSRDEGRGRPRKARQKRVIRDDVPILAETYEDIVRDNARLEKEISLDIESVRQMHFDLG